MVNKAAVIIFHKNSWKYPLKWVTECISSIKNQTYKKFDVFEIDYGGNNVQIYSGSRFMSVKLADHAEAHNFLLDIVFFLGYDSAFNVNIDDFYALDRFEKQLKYVDAGYDIISSNFHNIDGAGTIINDMQVSKLNIGKEFKRGHNIIAHPVLCYSRNFWTSCTRLNPKEIPVDDFNLWKRSIDRFKFVILPEYLLYYRVHNDKISKKKETGQLVSSMIEEIIEQTDKEKQDEIHNKKREEWLKNNP